MTAIFDRLVTDQVSLVVHAYLLIFCVLATYVCIRGIRWESRGPLSVHSVAGKLVIWGVAIEAVCTIALFVFDEGISSNQQSTIISLQRQLVGFLEPRTLTQGQKDRIVETAKQFPSVSFVAATAFEEEPWELLLEISKTLRDSGWKWEPFPENAGYLRWQPMDPNLPPEGATISNRFVLVVPPSLRDVADALAAALTDPSIIGMEKVPVLVRPNATKMTIIAGTKR